MNFIRGKAYADYEKAVRVAFEVLEDYKITQMPLQMDQIIDALFNEVALTTYSRLMELDGLSLAEVIHLMDSDTMFYGRILSTCMHLLNTTMVFPTMRAL